MCTLADSRFFFNILLTISLISFGACSGKKDSDNQSSPNPNNGNDGGTPITVPLCSGALLTNLPYASGDGSISNPYLICTADQLNNIGKTSADWSSYFTLKADIDLTYFDGSSAEKTFTSIGNIDTLLAYTGTFDGDNHTISNYTFPTTGAGTSGAGIFSYIQGTVKNLIMSNASVSGTNQTYVGILAAYAKDANISNISVTNSTVTGSSNVGGAIGLVENGTFSKIQATGMAIAGTTEVGGLIGLLLGGVLSNLNSSGTINGSSNVGGLIGYMELGTNTLSLSYSTATVSTTNNFAGGLVGSMGFPSGGGVHTITDSFFAGGISGVSRLGGITGALYGSISNVYSSGSVTGSGTFNGGLVGQSVTASFQNSYSTATVSGTTSVGGAIGGGVVGSINNVYYTDSHNNAKGTQALNDPITVRSAASASWDFSTVWLSVGLDVDPTLR